MNYQVSPEKNAKSGRFGSGLKVMLAVALMTLSILSFGQSPEVREAFRLIDIEQPSKGIAALEKLDKSDAKNLYYLGLGYLKTGDKAKALQAFEKGISVEEKEGLNYAGKGHVKLLEKNTTEAKANFDKALAVSKSKKADVLIAVAEGYLADSKYLLDAISLLNKAKGMEASNPRVHMLLGDAYLMQNNGGESVSSYERAASADPKSGKPNYRIAKVYQRSKNYDMVLENLNKSIAADPQFAPSYKELGELYYIRKQPDQAVEAYEKYLPITENAGQAKFQLAFFYFMAKRFDKANEIFKEVINSPNASPTALKYYVYSLVEQKKYDTARVVFDRYFQTAKPEDLDAGAYAYYGKLLLELNEDSLANIAFAESLDRDSAQQDVLYQHATTLSKRRKFDEAIPVFKELMKQRSQPLSQDLWSIGQAYYFNGNYMEADTAFTQLSERQPTVTHGFLWAAKARAQVDSLGESGIAIPMYEKYLEIALQNPEKNKRDIVDAYDYLGQWALHKEDNVLKAKEYFQKILQLDPTNARAQEFMKVLKQAESPQKGGR